ncbi:hypothetical protein EIH79_03760 [Paenibacillus tundrae]|nr:hypothetical protein [Paenibacillus tundrae]
MSEKWNVELHMSPGGWTAEVSAASDASKEVLAAAGKTESAEGLFTVTGTLQQFSEAEREAVLAQLRKRPLALYALLRGGPAPAELAGLLPAAPSEAELGTAAGGSLSAGGTATCTCGRTGCAHAAAAERAVAARFAAEPLLQLAHAGLPREALLTGVLGSWAEELAHDPSGPGRAAVGEWIAEAAADGAMHQPGPGFGAVKVRLAQPGKPPATPELAALLPGVPATAGLALIRERVAARMWEAVQKKKKDSPATK